MPLAPTQTLAHPPMHAYIHTRTHINTRARIHTYMNTLQVNTRDIIPSFLVLQMKELQLDSTVRFDSDLSSMLNLSLKCIFILVWPAAVVVAHDATQHDRKE